MLRSDEPLLQDMHKVKEVMEQRRQRMTVNGITPLDSPLVSLYLYYILTVERHFLIVFLDDF